MNIYKQTKLTCTGSLTEPNTVTWKISNFVNCIRDLNVNQVLYTDKSVKRGFSLKFESLDGNPKYLSIYFTTPYNAKTTCSMTILDWKEYCIDQNNGFFNRYSTEIIKKNKLYSSIKPNKWQHFLTLDKDIINKRLEDSFKNVLIFKICHKDDYICIPEISLQNDFENLLSNGLYSDVIIKSTEDIEFKVHKAVLASRSAVLQAAVKKNSICGTDIITSPFESDILKEILTYIYSDKAPKIDEMPEKLLDAADFYQLGGLKRLCEKSLYKKLTFENAIEMLELADLYSASLLKRLTLKFIKKTPTDLITKTDGWLKLESTELVKSIYEFKG